MAPCEMKNLPSEGGETRRTKTTFARRRHARWMSFALRATSIATTLTSAGPMYAQEARPANAPPPTESERARAKELFDDGIRRYNIGDYDHAIERFRAAYLLSSAPPILYNIAQAYRLQGPGHCGQALAFYRTFLRVDPTSSKRAAAEAAARDMEKCAEEEPKIEARARADDPSAARTAGASAPPAPSNVTSAPSEHDGAVVDTGSSVRTRHASLGLLIGGIGVALVGGGLFAWSGIRHAAIENSGCAPSCDPSETAAPRSAQTAGLVTLGAGVAIAAAGLVWILIQNRGTTATSIAPVKADAAFAAPGWGAIAF